MRRPSFSLVRHCCVAGAVAALLLTPARAAAQDVSTPNPADSGAKEAAADSADSMAISKPMANTTAGEFTPGKGFQIFTHRKASLNISVYGLFRYIDQTPGNQTYVDHLGRTQTVSAMNAFYWQRSMIWFTGFFGTPRLRYNLTVWSLGATQQTLVFGNLQFIVNRSIILGAGMSPNLTERSMQGSWPFWAGSDRQMAEEFMRGGFSTGVFVTGQPLDRFWYTASINTNLSQLGITAANDARSMSYSASVMWMPTTGEFGPRGGFGDLEYHKELATRFGASSGYAPSEYRAAPLGQPNAETQLRLSDGLFAFAEGSLAPGVTVNYLAYNDLAIDAGFKYRGWSFQTEGYWRQLSNFRTDLPQPVTSITDKGLQAQVGYMVVPHFLMAYVSSGYLWDQFRRFPWEISPGASYYPFATRSWRINLHMIYVYKSPTGSTFGYYTAGQTGTTVSLATDILF